MIDLYNRMTTIIGKGKKTVEKDKVRKTST